MKNILCGLCLLGSGCESCDFGLGPIPLEIWLTPSDVLATLTVCDEEGDRTVCETLQSGPLPSDAGGAGTPPGSTPEGVVSTYASWDGTFGCHFPALEIDVEAEGCEPLHVSVPKERSSEPPMRVDIALDCP